MEDEKVPISHLPKIKTFNGRGFHEFWMGEERKGERGFCFGVENRFGLIHNTTMIKIEPIMIYILLYYFFNLM